MKLWFGFLSVVLFWVTSSWAIPQTFYGEDLFSIAKNRTQFWVRQKPRMLSKLSAIKILGIVDYNIFFRYRALSDDMPENQVKIQFDFYCPAIQQLSFSYENGLLHIMELKDRAITDPSVRSPEDSMMVSGIAESASPQSAMKKPSYDLKLPSCTSAATRPNITIHLPMDYEEITIDDGLSLGKIFIPQKIKVDFKGSKPLKTY